MKKNIVGTRRYLRRLCWLNFDAKIKKLGTKQQKILVNKQRTDGSLCCSLCVCLVLPNKQNNNTHLSSLSHERISPDWFPLSLKCYATPNIKASVHNRCAVTLLT